MTYSINWPITVHSAVPFCSGNYIFPKRRGTQDQQGHTRLRLPEPLS